MRKLAALVTLSLATFACVVAHAAEAAGATTVPDPMMVLWPTVGAVATTAWGALSAYVQKRYAFMDHGLGHLAILAVGAVVGSVATALTQGHWTRTALAGAAVGGLLTFLGKMNAGTAGATAREAIDAVASPTRAGGQAGRASLFILMIVALVGFASAVVLAGCATSQTAKDATLAQKLKADAQAFSTVCHDVEQKCGPNLLSFVKTVNDLIATATSYTDLVQDIVHAAAIYHDAQMDIASIECVISTVRNDLKNLSPKKAAILDMTIAWLYEHRGAVELAYLPLPIEPMLQPLALVETCKEGDLPARVCRPIALDCSADEDLACFPEAATH